MKKLYIIRLLIVLSGLSFACSTKLNSQSVEIDLLSTSSRISILTSSPWTEEIYAVFGHSALRINDPVNNIDEVYNYGIFDFDTPNFTWRFATGQTDYIVSKINFERYLPEYQWKNVNVYEQILNLSLDEKQSIRDFLENNIKPENRTYRYNEIFNNCTTKLTDLLETHINGDIIYPQEDSPKTFRELLSEFMQVKPWMEFGVNLVFGSGADSTASLREKMFLPLYQVRTFDKTKIRTETGELIPLVSEKRNLHVSSKPTSPQINFMTSPLIIGIFLLLITLIISLLNFKGKINIIAKIFDFLLFLSAGIAGCVILFLMFTSHPFTFPNWNIMWLNPLQIILAFLIIFQSRNKYVVYFQLANILLISVFILIIFFISQKFEIYFLPFLLSIYIRSLLNTINKSIR